MTIKSVTGPIYFYVFGDIFLRPPVLWKVESPGGGGGGGGSICLTYVRFG